jgi:hypothetical protein
MEPVPVFEPEADIFAYERPAPDPAAYTEVVEEDVTENIRLNHIAFPQTIGGETRFAKRISIARQGSRLRRER